VRLQWEQHGKDDCHQLQAFTVLFAIVLMYNLQYNHYINLVHATQKCDMEIVRQQPGFQYRSKGCGQPIFLKKLIRLLFGKDTLN